MNRLNTALVSVVLWLSGGQLIGVAQAQQTDIFSTDDLLQSIGTALGCELSSTLMADMTVNPLYSAAGLQCLPSNPGASGAFFTDEACRNEIAFAATSQQQFCAEAIDRTNLGNGATVVEGRWTLSPGTRYDVGAASLTGLTQPYRTSQIYRRVNRGTGDCLLEMRIYKNMPGATGQRPLIALHGGSWSSRGFGAFGIEATVAHYTDQGFTVFAPFYRLLGDSAAGPQCNDATLPQIVDDIEAALDWVEVQAPQYGASGKPIVFGQSAGAHLALSLAVNQSPRVAGAVLLYPPTDFEHFVLQARSGEYTNQQGLNILSKVLGEEAGDADISQSPIPENTFPAIVAPRPDGFPPMFIVHGMADELVLPDQSLRLCNALAGTALDQPVPDTAGLSQAVDCGVDSELHLFSEGKHALDICLSTNALLGESCLSGSAQSKALIAATLKDASRWSAEIAARAHASPVGGGGVAAFWVPVLLVGRHRRMVAADKGQYR